MSIIYFSNLQDWAGGILMAAKKTFFDYCSANTKENTCVDSSQIVMTAHYLGRNITILYGNGEKWTTDPPMADDIVLLYKGDYEFVPTEVGTYIFFNFAVLIAVY